MVLRLIVWKLKWTGMFDYEGICGDLGKGDSESVCVEMGFGTVGGCRSRYHKSWMF